MSQVQSKSRNSSRHYYVSFCNQVAFLWTTAFLCLLLHTRFPGGDRKLTAAHHSLLQPATWSPLILKFLSSHPLLVIHSLLFFNTNTQMRYYNVDLHSCFCCSLTQFLDSIRCAWEAFFNDFKEFASIRFCFFSSKELKAIWWSDPDSWERLPRLPRWW